MNVLITGASSGIGAKISERLVNDGHTVFGAARGEISVPDVVGISMDVSSDLSVETAMNELFTKVDHLDVVINNAGIGLAGPLEVLPIEELIYHFNVNVFGSHRINSYIIPRMKEQKQGKIIHISSIASRLAIPYQLMYSSSKASLSLYSDGLRMELMKYGIQVCAIEPGDTKSSFDSRRVYAFNPEEHQEAMNSVQIMVESEKNGTDPAKIANLVSKLVMKRKLKSRYSTGLDAFFVKRFAPFFPNSLKEYLLMKLYKVQRKIN